MKRYSNKQTRRCSHLHNNDSYSKLEATNNVYCSASPKASDPALGTTSSPTTTPAPVSPTYSESSSSSIDHGCCCEHHTQFITIPNKPFECHLCHTFLSTKQSLLNHMRAIHKIII